MKKNILNSIDEKLLPAGAQVKDTSMRTSISKALAVILLVSTAACQRPTEKLPPAPQFEMQSGEPEVAPQAPAPVNDVVSVSDNSGIVPGSVEDFLRYAGTDKVYFEYDSADLTDEGRATLGRQAEWLVKYPKVNVSLEGHADERGTREYNFALGERRSAAMKFFLSVRGVSEGRITTTSFGKERPMVAGSDDQSWGQNRRGETVLIGAVGQH